MSLKKSVLLFVVCCSVWLVVTASADAAVIFDAASAATTGANTATTLSWSHTTSGTERILVVGVSINTNTSVSSVAYNGVPLIKIIAQESGSAVRVSLWYLINPPVGAHAVMVTMSAAARFVAGAHSYTGVHQTNPLGTPVVANAGSGTSASLTVQSNTNEVVVDVLARRGDLITNPISAGSGQVARWNQRTTINNANTGVTGGGSSKPGTLSTVMSWTWSVNRAWVIAGVSLKQSLPPDATPPLRFNGLPSGTLSSGTTQATMSLTTDENATCRYSDTAGVPFASMTNTFSTTGGTSHSQVISGLADNTSYAFYIRCSDAAGNRNGDDFIISFSITASPPDTQAPSIPANLQATAVSTSNINLSWDASTDNVAVTGYRIYRDSNLIATIAQTNYSDTGLSPLTFYTYTVSAFDAANNESAQSASASATTLVTPDTQAPLRSNGIPSGILPSNTTSVTLSLVTDENAVCKYDSDADTDFNSMANIFSSTGGITHQSSAVQVAEGISYNFYIRCNDESNNVNTDDFIISFSVAVFIDTDSPAVPSDLSLVSVSASSVSFSWSVSSDNVGVAGYKIYRNGLLIASTLDDQYTDIGLNDGTAYAYTVSAYDAANNESAQSNALSITTLSIDSTPPFISNISADDITSSSAIISWDTDEISSSLIEYGFTALYGSSISNSNFLTSHSVSLSGLSGGSLYHFRVRATDGSSNFSISTDKTFSTLFAPDIIPPSVVADLSASGTGQTFTELSWTAPGDDGFSGQAASYDIRFSTVPITNANWAVLPQLTGVPVPSFAGAGEHYVVVGLSPATTYYFALRSIDDADNVSELSNIVFITTRSSAGFGDASGGGGSGYYPSDTIPPATPKAVTILPAEKQIRLHWENPSDLDFVRVVIIRQEGRVPLSLQDGVRVYEGNGQEFTDIAVHDGILYYYAISAYDRILNYSEFVIVSGMAQPGVGQISSIAIPKKENTDDKDSAEKQGAQALSLPQGGIVHFTALLSLGARSEEVRQLQMLLARDPSLYPEGLITGYYGKLTRQAVQRFQCHYDIICSGDENTTGYGRVGPKTLAKLNEITAVGQSPIAGLARALYMGAYGDDVRRLQEFLSHDPSLYPEKLITGIFGRLTKEAVKRFQCKNNIICSGDEWTTGYGRAGPRTRSLLNQLMVQ